jgi:DNA-binding CsgD family transcriptional regulator/PAS domain-containing protein
MGGFNQSEFLDLVYGAALEPSLWAPAMERYADAIGGEKGWLSLLDIAGGAAGGIIARVDPGEMDRYTNHYADRNPLHLVDDPDRWVRTWAPRILTDEDWMPKSDLVASEYYNDFLKPQDIHSCIMVRLAVRGTKTAAINITRSRRRGQFDFADLELARSLHPHLLRAFDLGQKLATDRALNGGLKAVFDASPHGLFLVEADGRVRRMNAAGEGMAMAHRGLRVAGGRLMAIDPAAGRVLQTLVSRAASRDAGVRTGGSISVPTARGMVPLSATVAPVSTDALSVLDTHLMAIVCITDLEAGVRLPEQRLRDLFGLTAAEGRLALALFEGETVREAAQTLHISRFTAQNHLARVFEKTGTNRQAVLIKLMMQVVGLDLG